MATFHATFDLDSLIHRGEAARMAGHVRLPGAAEWATETEIIAHATILKAQGFETVLARLRAGDLSGQDHDDDFGYRFNVDPASAGPSFFDAPAGSN